MKNSDLPNIICALLEKRGEPLSLSELLAELPEKVATRTLRRWLAQLVQEGILEKIGNLRGTKYQLLCAAQNEPLFSRKSVLLIEAIKKPLYEREPRSYQSEWVESYEPNQDFYLTATQRSLLHQEGKRFSNHDPAGTYAYQIFNRLLIDLSYNSSRLEGNTYSLADTQRLIVQGIGAEGKLNEERIMILNHKEAIRYLVEQAPKLKVNVETICTLHYLLADGLLDSKHAGKVRDHGVRIGGSVYAPLEDPRLLASELARMVGKAQQIQDPFEQSLFLLVHVSYLQAFADVNKRTARLSANIPLITKNYVPLSFNDVERSDYMSAMIVLYELQEVTPLIDLYIYSYLRTCNAYDETVKTVGFDEVRVRYRAERRAVIRTIIVNQIVKEPMMAFIKSESKRLIPQKDQAAFIDNALTDLEHIDSIRIAGLGVTQQELDHWLALSSRKK